MSREPESSGSTDEPVRSLVYRLLEDYCRSAGLILHAADPYGHAGMVEDGTGRRWFFKGTRFDLNGYGASEIANDKAYAAGFLKENGLSVPAGLFVASSEISGRKRLPPHILDFAETSGFPLYVKPNIGKEGRDVTRVDTFHTLQSALEMLAERHDALILQQNIRGWEYRLYVLDDDVLCAVERTPPQVIGNGSTSLAELIDVHGKIDPADHRIDVELSAQVLTLDSVPEAGQVVPLLPVANLSAGGAARIVTGTIAPELVDIARRAAGALALRYVGVDLIVPDGAGSPAGVVLEVNAAPGLASLHRQSADGARMAEDMYRRIFAALFSEHP